ncbi:hypothetical protein HYU11_04440 [Candidatus Woesearchaeota archaeon]|nr:hypothetical protein [Candidatus Woesearchaeota archaeon]
MRIFKFAVCKSCNNSFPSSYFAEFICPVCSRKAMFGKLKERLSKESFFGSFPAPFIGRFGYPDVNVGLLSPGFVSDDAWAYDSPSFWADRNLGISEVVDYRSGLVNSRSKASVRGNDRIIGIAQEVALSSVPVDLDVSFSSPVFSLGFSQFNAPVGPAVSLKKAQLASNPKIHHKVERVFSDSGWKSVDAVDYLFSSGFNVDFLSRVLSVGALGLKSGRRLVPTRFSITAVDDIVGKRLIDGVKGFSQVNDFMAFFGGYLGNYYLVLFFPDVWGYELFESYEKGDDFSTDFESYFGRKSYAQECAGGYYAARLPILEKLNSMRRQASVLVIRVITSEYLLPLGVWVCREAVRKAISNPPLSFASKELLLKYASAVFRRKFSFDISKILNSSRLLQLQRQSKLNSFF